MCHSIQCDGNALNIIVDEERNEVKAFIDFGDVSHTSLVNELAILMAYAMIDKIRKEEKAEGGPAAEKDTRILEVGRNVLQGYGQVSPLSDTELRLLPCLVKARLVTSVLFSAHTLLQRPEDKDYLTVPSSLTPGLFPLLLKLSSSSTLTGGCSAGLDSTAAAFFPLRRRTPGYPSLLLIASR